MDKTRRNRRRKLAFIWLIPILVLCQVFFNAQIDIESTAVYADSLPDHIVNGDFEYPGCQRNLDDMYFDVLGGRWYSTATTAGSWHTLSGFDKSKFGWRSTQPATTDAFKVPASTVQINNDTIYTFVITKDGDTLLMQDGSGATIQDLSEEADIQIDKEDSAITSGDRLSIHKTDAQGNNLGNVSYTLYYDEKCTIPVAATYNGTASDSQVLINYVANANGTFTANKTGVDGRELSATGTFTEMTTSTASNGYATFYNLPDGEYYLKEDSTGGNAKQLLSKPIHIGVDQGLIYIESNGWQKVSEILIQNSEIIPVLNTGGEGMITLPFYGASALVLVLALRLRKKYHAA